MKTLLALVLLAVAFCASGCSTVPRAVEASATKFNLQTSDGKTISIELPKDSKVEVLDVSVDPTTGKWHIKADKIEANASTVLDSAGAVQANALARMAEAVNTLAPLVVPKPAN